MSLLLLIHIASALLLTISCISLLVYGILRKQIDNVLGFSQISFGATLSSGVVLVVISPSSLTHLCVMMTVYSLATFGVQSLYKKRSQTALLPQENTV